MLYSTNSRLEVKYLMNKTREVAQNSVEGTQKETFHGKKKSGPSREYQTESHNEDFDRAPGHYSKNTSHFDYSNLSLFFGGRPNQLKSPTEHFAGKLHSKKKSNETSSSKEGTLKHTSSKDYSNLDELFENTTIINNPPHSKKRSNEITLGKNQSEEGTDAPLGISPEAALFKNHNKKKSSKNSFSSLLKAAPKEDKLDQEIAEDISKLGLNLDDDQEKTEMNNFKDIKVSKNNLKVLDRIKNKTLNYRQGAFINNTFEPPKSTPHSQIETRTNNNSVFTNVNVSKLTKGKSYSE